MLLFTIVGAIYGVKTYNTGERTYELTERSVQFVQDQLRLAKESGQSSDRLLGEILDHLKHMDWTRSNIGKTSPSSQPMSSKWKR
jgi:hypothetical protein